LLVRLGDHLAFGGFEQPHRERLTLDEEVGRTVGRVVGNQALTRGHAVPNHTVERAQRAQLRLGRHGNLEKSGPHRNGPGPSAALAALELRSDSAHDRHALVQAGGKRRQVRGGLVKGGQRRRQATLDFNLLPVQGPPGLAGCTGSHF
jgi:hypothetical protein